MAASKSAKSETPTTTVLPPPGAFAVFSNGSAVTHAFHKGRADATMLVSVLPGTYELGVVGFSVLRVLTGALRVKLPRRRTIVVGAGQSLDLRPYQRRPGWMEIASTSFTQALLAEPPTPASDSVDGGFSVCRPKPLPPVPRGPTDFSVVATS